MMKMMDSGTQGMMDHGMMNSTQTMNQWMNMMNEPEMQKMIMSNMLDSNQIQLMEDMMADMMERMKTDPELKQAMMEHMNKMSMTKDMMDSGMTPIHDTEILCPPSGQKIIDKYNLLDLGVENCDVKSFSLDGKQVDLVHIIYGEANDCPAGCFYAHYCAIVEDGIDYPFIYYVNHESENFLGGEELYGDFEIELTGQNHDLASSPEFIEFLEEERGNGPYRWCVPR